MVAVDINTNEVKEVIEGFRESKYKIDTLRRLDIKLSWKKHQLLKKYPHKNFKLISIKCNDFGDLKKRLTESDGICGWEGIIPQLIDIKVNSRLIDEIYNQIPEKERTGLDDQAKVIGEENNKKFYVVETWLIRQRIGESHESEK